MSETSVINHHTALVYVMVLVSASDGDMTDAELAQIGNIVTHLPVFRDFDPDDLSTLAASCTDLLQEDDGLDTALALVREALPEKLRETAYALACDVAAADGAIAQEELRLLEIIRHELRVGRLPAAPATPSIETPLGETPRREMPWGRPSIRAWPARGIGAGIVLGIALGTAILSLPPLWGARSSM